MTTPDLTPEQIEATDLAEWRRQLTGAAERCCQCTDGHHDQAARIHGTDQDVRVPRDTARHLASLLTRLEAAEAALRLAENVMPKLALLATARAKSLIDPPDLDAARATLAQVRGLAEEYREYGTHPSLNPDDGTWAILRADLVAERLLEILDGETSGEPGDGSGE